MRSLHAPRGEIATEEVERSNHFGEVFVAALGHRFEVVA